MGILQVGLGERSYPLIVESGCLAAVPAELAARWPASCYCLVADDTVAALYGQQLLEALRAADLAAEMLSFPAGEASKTIDTVAWLASAAARLGLDRRAVIIALGGGVTGDLAGFLASAYLRGVDFVQVPTSLLAQVDSSVGGKTGVDLPEGKNLFGSFYQPKAVFIDPQVLQTLPEIHYRNGLAEVIKYGVIREPAFLDYLEQHRDAILALEPAAVSEVILTCCRIKADGGGRRRARGRSAADPQFRPHHRPCGGSRLPVRGIARHGRGHRHGGRRPHRGAAGAARRRAGRADHRVDRELRAADGNTRRP